MIQPMTEAEFRSEVTALAPAPLPKIKLTDPQFDSVTRRARRRDNRGRAVDHPNYIPTFDLEWGVSECFKVLISNAAGLHDYKEQDQQFSRAQIVANLRASMRDYRRGAIGSFRLGAGRFGGGIAVANGPDLPQDGDTPEDYLYSREGAAFL